MKNKKPLLIPLTLIVGIFYGILFGKYEIFPFEILKEVFTENNVKTGPWSIGIYEGPSPFELSSPKENINPVLTADDITDIDAEFVADPFMIFNNGKYFMFFEVLNRATNQGDISFAESLDGKKWDYKKVAIDEDFHLSYPYVFEWENEHYIIPESNEDLSVRLYKATSFPDQWEYLGNILSGFEYTDPCIFRHHNKWWLFVSNLKNNVLNLYFSDNLRNGWKPHPLNPIVRDDANIARGGGRVITYNDKLYRFAQDDDPSYGLQAYALEIMELTDTTYSEKLVKKPTITKSGKGWNAEGMHHMDVHFINNTYLSTVDGKDK